VEEGAWGERVTVMGGVLNSVRIGCPASPIGWLLQNECKALQWGVVSYFGFGVSGSME
jgi:hypothetical protein